MTQLKITIYGTATELLIGSFPKDGADWILEYCEEFKPYTDIEKFGMARALSPKNGQNKKLGMTLTISFTILDLISVKKMKQNVF